MSGAPWSFGAIAIVALMVGFGVSTLWWSGTVGALRERVGLYEDRLKGVPPDQTKTRQDDFEKRVPRTVAPEKRQDFIADLRTTTGTVYIISDTTVPDHAGFMADLMNLFYDAGWKPEQDVFIFGGRDRRRGIAVFSKPTTGKAQKAAILKAFAGAGMVAVETDDISPKEGLNMGPWGRDYDVGIRIYDRY